MSRPEVSVVIPTRNRLGLLAQTLRTVLAQTHRDLEVIVVDEASTDDTPRWLAQHPDERVRTLRHDAPRGLSEARNAGIAVAEGRWLAFVDDDDLWMPGKLADQLQAAKSQGACWAFGGVLKFTPEPRLLEVHLLPPDQVRLLPWGNLVPGGGSNAIVSRSALDEVGTFDPTIDIAADWDLWIRLLRLGEPAVVPHPVMAYRIHGGNMSKGLDRMFHALGTIEHRYRHLRGGEPIDWAAVYDWMGQRAREDGDPVTAARMALRALLARHPGAGKRLARSVIPVHMTRPVPDRSEATTLLDRLRKRALLPWPPGSEEWIREALATTADGTAPPPHHESSRS